MIEPLQLFWIFGIVVLVLTLVALWEIQRSYYRREHEVMFGTPLFDAQIKELGLLPDEIRVLEKLVRSSKYENKDAILNTATLFESAVSNYYDFKGEENVKKDVLEVIARLRRKLNFTAANHLATVTSTNCRYELPSDTIVLIPGDMLFSNVPIKDKYGNIANVSGGIHHRHLGRIAYDVHIKTDKLLAYDIPTLDGSTYCGKAVSQGNVGIKGKGNELNVDADVTTLDDSYIIYNTTSPDMVSIQAMLTLTMAINAQTYA